MGYTDNDYEIAFYYMLNNEGGLSKHVFDKGGPTRAGVSLRLLRQMFDKGSLWIDVNKDGVVDERDLLTLSFTMIKNIYKEQFWKPVEKIHPIRIATKVFDAGVNIGPAQAIKLVQRVCNLKEDGIVGPLTLKAIKSRKTNEFLALYVDKLKKYYYNIVAKDEKQGVFLDGWLRRAERLPGEN